MNSLVSYVLLGLAAGIASGILGIGGGLILIPAMTLIFGLTQQQAQGTSLAVLIPPVGILAAMTYYRAGLVNLRMGFVFGALAGSRVAVHLPNDVLRRVFGVFIVAAGVSMIVKK
jgi:uncharacterized protein